jgi:hypothetical protein
MSRFDKCLRRIERLRAAVGGVAPKEQREAWWTWKDTGKLPDRPELRQFCLGLEDAFKRLAELHHVVTPDGPTATTQKESRTV